MGVLQHLLVGLGFDADQCLEQFAFGLGDIAFFLQAFVDAGVLGITPLFGAQLVVLAVELFDLVMDCVERPDVGGHLFLADFAELLFLEQAFQLFAQGEEFGITLVKVVRQRFACLSQGVFKSSFTYLTEAHCESFGHCIWNNK